jgi:lactate dehydrogenase-like 2-hydroxyacid dehydrogenase
VSGRLRQGDGDPEGGNRCRKGASVGYPPGDPLLALPELVLTPHNGGMTREVIDNGVLRAVENIQLFLDGKPRDLVVPPPGR